MNIALWVVAGLLAAVFLAAGLGKLSRPKDALYSSGMKYVEDFSALQVKLIGGVEVLGAIGLVLPPLVGIAPVLAPIAAVGLAVTMVGAALTHARRAEWSGIAVPVVLLLLAVFVAVGRFWLAPF